MPPSVCVCYRCYAWKGLKAMEKALSPECVDGAVGIREGGYRVDAVGIRGSGNGPGILTTS